MSYTTVEIHIPEAMKPYITENNAEDELQRNALLLYPVEIILDEADRAAKETDVRYTHEEVFSRVRRNIGGR